MNEVRENIEQQMNDLMEEMSKREMTEDEYGTLTKRLVDLAKIRNDALKIECDYERQAENADLEAAAKDEQLKEEKRQFKIKSILDVGKICVSVLVLVGLGIAESKGTFTTMSFKDTFKGMKFGIK